MSPDIHTLSGAYSLDAVEPEERDVFETHLAECESCRDEVRALQAAASALADAFAQTPPESLRTKVMAAIEQTPQAPPLAAPKTSTVGRTGASTVASTVGSTEASTVGNTGANGGTVTPLRAPKHPTRRSIVTLVAAAAAVVAFLGVGARVWSHNDQPPAPSYSAAEVFGSADARVEKIALTGGQVRLGVSEELGLLAVDGADMPPPPADKVYQLWLIQPDGSSQSLAVMEDGVATAVTDLPDSGQIAVTTEPHGGSAAPTSPPVLQVDPDDI